MNPTVRWSRAVITNQRGRPTSLFGVFGYETPVLPLTTPWCLRNTSLLHLPVIVVIKELALFSIYGLLFCCNLKSSFLSPVLCTCILSCCQYYHLAFGLPAEYSRIHLCDAVKPAEDGVGNLALVAA